MALAARGVAALTLVLFAAAWLVAVTGTRDALWDEGLYHHVGWLWFSGQGWPWRDAWENKPPVIYAMYGLSHLVSALPLVTMRLLTGMCLAGSAALVRHIGLQLALTRAAANWGAVAFGVVALGPALDTHAALTEPPMVLLVCASLALATRPRTTESPTAWDAACGALAATAVLTKQPALVESLLGLALVARPSAPGARQRAAAWVGGFAAVQGLMLGVAAVGGVTVDYLRATWGFLGAGADGPPNLVSRFSMVSGLFTWLGARVAVVALAGAAPWTERATRVGVVWLLCSAPGILGGWTWNHQFLACVPALALLVAAGVHHLGQVAPRATHGLLLAGLSMTLLGNTAPLTARFLANPPDTEDALASLVVQHSAPTDTLFVYPLQDEVYARAERRSPTRHFNPNFLRNPAVAAEQRQQLSAQPPTLMLLSTAPWQPRPFFHAPAEDELRAAQDRWIRALAAQCHHKVAELPGWELWRRTTAEGTPCVPAGLLP